MKALDIHFENCTVGYGDYIVLRDITATLPAGKISVILGGSGCGKSTLLRHIVGLSRPLSGKVTIGNEDIFSLSARDFRRARRRVGMLFQDGALLGALSLVDNVALPLREHTTLDAATVRYAALRTFALVWLEDVADFYPNPLSAGSRTRAVLPRAIFPAPPLLPFAVSASALSSPPSSSLHIPSLPSLPPRSKFHVLTPSFPTRRSSDLLKNTWHLSLK